MKSLQLRNLWFSLRKKVSSLLIVCLLIPNISQINLYAKSSTHQFIPEIEVQDNFIDDSMFYIPHSSFDAYENDSKSKYVFKVARKGDVSNKERVKLTMLDMSGKYNVDYSIKVIDKAFFSENVQNANVSKSVQEFMSDIDYEEYSFSDAVVDGSVTSDMILSEDEEENLLDEPTEVFEDETYQVDEPTEPEEDNDSSNSEEQNETEIEEETVNGFTNTDSEDTEEEQTNEETTTEEQITEETTSEETTTLVLFWSRWNNACKCHNSRWFKSWR